MKAKTKALLTVECKEMVNPKQQRSRFDQTLGSASWQLQENKQPVVHKSGAVTTASVWGKIFGHRKSKEEIGRLTQNLLKRATDYAEIVDYSSEIQFETVNTPDEEFSHAPVLFSED